MKGCFMVDKWVEAKPKSKAWKITMGVIGIIAIIGFIYSCGIVENKLNALADEAATKFNTTAIQVKTQEDAKNCIDYYKTMEMDFIKFKVKHDIAEPLDRFHAQTSNALTKLEADFKAHPEYGSFESLMKKLGE